MKLPTLRSSIGFSTYLSEDNGGGWGWQVENTAGSPVAGSLRIVVAISLGGGFSGTPLQEGERDPVDNWNFLTGRQDGTQYGWHCYWQWWQSGRPTSYWYHVKQDEREYVYMAMILYTIDGADPTNPIEINGSDPNDATVGLGYADREWVNTNAAIAGTPVVDIAGVVTPTAPELMILSTATHSSEGANNIWHFVLPEGVTTPIRRVKPLFPIGSFEDFGMKPGSDMGTGLVFYGHQGVINSVGLSPTLSRECWRWLDDPDFAELANATSTTFPEDTTPPIIQSLAGSFRLAIRGKPSGLVAMI